MLCDCPECTTKRKVALICCGEPALGGLTQDGKPLFFCTVLGQWVVDWPLVERFVTTAERPEDLAMIAVGQLLLLCRDKGLPEMTTMAMAMADVQGAVS
jgi:hypothetical protein